MITSIYGGSARSMLISGSAVSVGDLLFHQAYAFFIAHLASRRVVYVAVTRHLTQA